MNIHASAFCALLTLVLTLSPLSAFASTSSGSIDSSFKLTKICKNPTCSVFGNVNWKPTINAQTPGALPVTINDTGVTGHLWGDEIGWIDLSPSGAGVQIDPNTGALSGKAFSQGGSWINFNPTGAGVFLIDTGTGSELSGWAWVNGFHGGWMKFNCSSDATCIRTDWRALSYRESTPEPLPSDNSDGSRHKKKHRKNIVPILPPLSSIIDTDSNGLPDNFYPSDEFTPQIDSQNLPLPRFPYCIESSKSHCELFPNSNQTCENTSPCLWCIINKKGQDLIINASVPQLVSRNIIKLGFVPETLEWRFPASSIVDGYTDIDITSLVLLMILPWYLWWRIL